MITIYNLELTTCATVVDFLCRSNRKNMRSIALGLAVSVVLRARTKLICVIKQVVASKILVLVSGIANVISMVTLNL